MNVLLHAIKCFVMALVYQLSPFVIGGVIGWILRGEKNDKERREKKDDV